MRKAVFIILVVLIPISLFSQNKVDTESISEYFMEFYDWYISSIHDRKGDEYKPVFAENESGMTTLSFEKYQNKLKEFHFSDKLIQSEIESYQFCIENLNKVKFDSLYHVFDDIDKLEAVECDFGNYFRWTGGMEPVGGIKIIKTSVVDSETVIVIGQFYDINSKTGEYYYWEGGGKATFRLIDNTWKIDELNLVKV